MSLRDRFFVGEPKGQNLDADKLSIAQEIAWHEPLSGIEAAAAIVGNYSRQKSPRGSQGDGSTAGQRGPLLWEE
jgi:hypothetical protein